MAAPSKGCSQPRPPAEAAVGSELHAPDAPGDYEIRYVMTAPGADATVIARRPITIR
jgi:hypothetical protein